MDPTPITVFGGTGFLGRAVVRRLAQAGKSVRIAARRADATAVAGGDDRIERRYADIRDDDGVARAVQNAGGVVNAVGLYVEKGDATFGAVHVEGAGRVARHAREAGLRLVHVSGIGADPHSRSRYVAARGRGEAVVRSEYPDTVIVRPSVLFGPGDAFLQALELATRVPVVPLFGRGRTRLQPVHIDDVAAAIDRLFTPPLPAERLFELGGAGIHTYREILQLVLGHLGRRRLLLPLPFAAWRGLAGLASVLPGPPLTVDQVILMQADNIAGGNAGTFGDLDIQPRAFAEALGECLRGGG